MPKDRIRAAAVQLRPSRESVKDTILDAVRLGKRAAEKEADIICFPEHWIPEREIPAKMDPLPALQSLAEEYGVMIVGGAFYERIRGHLYLSSPLINADGDVAGRQFKVHLFRSEKKLASPGRSHRKFNLAGYSFGILVCYDIDFPESARSLALEGADLLFCPSRIVKHGTIPWHQYLTVRALENRIPIVAPNVYAPPWFLGSSVIVDLHENPKTKISYPRLNALHSGQETGIITRDLDLAYHRRLRRDRFLDRRPTAYQASA
ncbi:MAG TPA: carbon-nitrogen hydrolase family protein [Candidatus Binatus sp.]|nr:carbon-nitrogen hydrolase family protein [Candidatus Binatus sp.]